MEGQRPPLEEGEKFMEVYDIWDRQLSQEAANYSVAGGLSGNPCATCRWFVSPDACVVVADWPEAISAIGTSDRYEAKVALEVDAIPVMIIEEGEASANDTGVSVLKVSTAIKDAVLDFARKLVAPEGAKAIGTEDGIRLFKTKDGTLRWFAWASNKWQDRDEEIFEEKAHKEFVDYLADGGQYPEAWVWHTPGTRWGVADWADYSDGFLMYSGTVDKGMESVAEKIATTVGLGVSHGFRYLYSDKENGIIGWYRDYELSTLPLARAANLWTGIEIIAKGADMGFTKERREHLVGFFGEEMVKELEADTDGAKTRIENLGVAWKECAEFGEEDAKGMAAGDPAPDPKQEPTPEPVPAGFDLAAISAAAVKAIAESDGFKEFSVKLDIFSGRLSTIETTVKALSASDDEKIASRFTPRSQPNKGYRASDDDDNVSADGEKAEEEVNKRGPIASQFSESIYGKPEPASV